MANPLYPGVSSSSSSTSGPSSSSASASKSSSGSGSGSGSSAALTSSSGSKAGFRAPRLLGGSFASSGSKNTKSGFEYDPTTHPGILNLGNTCFLNSVLQAIGNTQDFRLLIQGSPAVELGHQGDASQLAPSLLRYNQWPDRSSSPALRVSDQEHGRKISSSSRSVASSIDTPVSATPTSPDPTATVKPATVPLPASPDSVRTASSFRSGPSASSATSGYEPSSADLPLNTAFRHVLEKIWCESNRHRPANVNPKRLLNLLGRKYDQYLEYGQQDGHELMRHLLDACRMEELDVIKKMRPSKSKQHKTRTNAASSYPASNLSLTDVENGGVISLSSAQLGGVDEDALQTQEHHKEKEEPLLPFLDLLFCGKLASMVVCESCRKVSHTYEDFYDISLSLRDDPANNKNRKRDRLRSMADRWRRATQTRSIADKKKASQDAAPADTPIGTPTNFSENEVSDVDSNNLRSKKSGAFLAPDEVRGRFQLRKTSVRKGARHEKMGATSGSEMEPDFPDMASLSLAPTSSRQIVDSAPPSAGEDNGDARTAPRLARMLGSMPTYADSSRETSPNPPHGDRSVAARDSHHRTGHPHRPIKSIPHQTAYIARILADDPAPGQPPAARQPGLAPSPLYEVIASANAAQGKPIHGFFRSAAASQALKRDHVSDFESDPHSLGAKRRRKIQEEQASTGLIAALRQFTSVEVLDGDNSFACKNCWRIANPPTAQEREALRRRRRRRGVADAEAEDEEASEPSSSDGESDHDEAVSLRRVKKADTSSVEGSAAASKATTSAAPNSRPINVPTISMTSDDTPLASAQPGAFTFDGTKPPEATSAPMVTHESTPNGHAQPGANGGQLMQHRLGSDSSLSSEGGRALKTRVGYETGAETDRSGISAGMDDTAESGAETTGTEEDNEPNKRSVGPKRSAQSLPRRALKRYLIASAPPVLIFHLKRFQATGRGFVTGLAGFKKIDDQVTFPEFLDITPWLAPPREEYDRRGRLKATSDPLAIRKRAEEEARNAGMDVSKVKVELQGKHVLRHWKGLHHHHPHHNQHHLSQLHGPTDGVSKGRKHSMWSWHIREESDKQHKLNAAAIDQSRPLTPSAFRNGELEAGPEVTAPGGRDLIPTVIRRPKTEYRLYAVIVHQGSLSAGHYTAYVLSDKIKLKDGAKDMVARSAPTSRSNTPAFPSGFQSQSNLGRQPSLNLGQFFLGGGGGGGGGGGQNGVSQQKPPRRFASPAPVPARPASAAPMTMASTPMTITPSSASSAGSTGSNNMSAVRPQTSISSLEADADAASSASASSPSMTHSEGPKLIRPRPQLKTMSSWDSLDELSETHQPTETPTPTSADQQPQATVCNTIRQQHAGEGIDHRHHPNPNPHQHQHQHQHHQRQQQQQPLPTADNDDVDPRKVDDGRRWVYTSDTIVRAATIDEVLKAKAYMLFYERI